jgi:DNA-damage-inducible protein J
MPVVCVRMDEETKRKFDAFCNSVGITISAAVNMFAKMTIREDRLPFDIKGSSTGGNAKMKKNALAKEDEKEE